MEFDRRRVSRLDEIYGLRSIDVRSAAFRVTAVLTLTWTKNVTALLVATAVATLIPLVIGNRYLTSRVKRLRSDHGPGALNGKAPLVVSVIALTVLTVLTVGFPTVGDVVIVRHVYEPEQAGLYAGVALVGRCVLFTSVAINVVLYPRYIKAKGHRDRHTLLMQGLLATVVLSGGRSCARPDSSRVAPGARRFAVRIGELSTQSVPAQLSGCCTGFELRLLPAGAIQKMGPDWNLVALLARGDPVAVHILSGTGRAGIRRIGSLWCHVGGKRARIEIEFE